MKTILPLIALMLLAVSDLRAYVVYNNTSYVAQVTIDDFDPVSISPGGSHTRSWESFADAASEPLRGSIVIESFRSDIALKASGGININEVIEEVGMRAQIEVRSTFGGSTVDVDGRLSSPGHRRVDFLATGDFQYNQHDRSNQEVRKYLSDATAEVLISRFNRNRHHRGILVAGDLTQFAVESEFDEYQEAMGDWDEYFYDGLGNHDFDPDSFEFNDDVRSEMHSYLAHKEFGTLLANRATYTAPQFPFPLNDIHYSWDWHDVHFVQLNYAPLNDDTQGEAKGYEESRNALDFLIADLASQVGTSGRPVVLVFHVGPNHDISFVWGDDQTEGEANLTRFWNAIKDYNVVALFNGHIHQPGITWAFPFRKPSSGDARPDGRVKIASFISGGATNGNDESFNGSGTNYFLDVSIIDEMMTVTRYEVNWTGSTNDEYFDPDDFYFDHEVSQFRRATVKVPLFPDRFKQGIDDDEFGPRPYNHSNDHKWVYTAEPAAGVPLPDGDACRTPLLGDNESAWFEIMVQGPKTLGFRWKVSSESSDVLDFSDNGNTVASISGTDPGFPSVSYAIPAGDHTLRWTYRKDGDGSAGEDRAWVDRIVLAIDEVAGAVEAPSLSFDPVFSGSDSPWIKVADSNRVDGDMAKSGTIEDFQESSTFVEMSGPAILQFDWRTSSEASTTDPISTGDELQFVLNSYVTHKLSGETPWQTVTVELPLATNSLKWEYDKNGSVSVGDDAGYLDNFRIFVKNGTAEEGLDLLPEMTVQQIGAPWYAKADVAGGDYTTFIPVEDNASTRLTTQITGPGVVSFRWRCDGARSINGDDTLSAFLVLPDPNNPLSAGEVSLARISGKVEEWQTITREIPAGSFEIGWCYYNDPDATGGSETASIDDFRFIPGTNNNTYPSLTKVEGAEVVQSGLDNPYDAWAFGGDGQWYGLKDTSNGGRDSATHTPIGDNEETWLETEIEGPRTLYFSWKVSSEQGYDWGRFLLNNVEAVPAITGEEGWTRHRIDIPSGLHKVRWQYEKDWSAKGGSDQLWLDGIAIMSTDFGVERLADTPNGVLLRLFGETFLDATGNQLGRSGYRLEHCTDLKVWQVVEENLAMNKQGVAFVHHSIPNDEPRGFYRLRWAPERLVSLTNAGFEDQLVADRGFSYQVPGWDDTGATTSFTEDIIGDFAPEGTNNLGLANGTGLGVASTKGKLRGRLTLDVAIGHRPTGGHTQAGNQSRYGFARGDDPTAFLADHPHNEWWFHRKHFIDASTIPSGTFVEAPPITYDNVYASGIDNPISVYLEAGGNGRSHYDNVRLWVEDY